MQSFLGLVTRHVAIAARLAASAAVASTTIACLDRPIVPTQPTTTNQFVDQIVQSSVNKIDLLFMVDNSASMADKQDILRAAVPVLVGRLVSPICLDASGAPTGVNSDPTGKCTVGTPEFPPIADIHVGIVTSSLGSHGGSVCAAAGPSGGQDNPVNDNAHLLGSVRPVGSNPSDPSAVFPIANSWNNSGFLAWDPGGKDTPPGTADASAFSSTFAEMIHATGQIGCGYEAQLESWYRFLIDPEPPVNVTRVGNSTVRGSSLTVNADGTTACAGCDLDLLAQRKAFLRPDSLVAIVMLSDENDCSIRDDGVGWFVATAGNPMPKATAVSRRIRMTPVAARALKPSQRHLRGVRRYRRTPCAVRSQPGKPTPLGTHCMIHSTCAATISAAGSASICFTTPPAMSRV